MRYATTEGTAGPARRACQRKLDGARTHERRHTVEQQRIPEPVDRRTMRDRRDSARGERDKEGDAPALVLALVEPRLPGDDHARDADDKVEAHVRGGERGVRVKAVVLRNVDQEKVSALRGRAVGQNSRSHQRLRRRSSLRCRHNRRTRRRGTNGWWRSPT